MTFIISARAKKDLDGLPTADRNAIIVKLESFAKTGAGDVKKLKGRDEYPLRHGDWRAIFELNDGVIILRVLHRSVAYK